MIFSRKLIQITTKVISSGNSYIKNRSKSKSHTRQVINMVIENLIALNILLNEMTK